jgi:polyisoprenoid-binding protein YceI
MTYRIIATLAATLVCLQPVASFAQKNAVKVEAPSGTYNLDKTHAAIIWKVSHFGLSSYPARFATFDAKLEFDAAKPENSKLSVTIDAASVRTEYPLKATRDFDVELANNEGFFNAKAHPTITFASTGIKRTGPKTADVMGNLTFRGVTKPMTLKAVFNNGMAKHPFAGVPVLGFSATGKLKRSEFGMTNMLPNIGDDVTLDIEAEFQGAK